MFLPALSFAGRLCRGTSEPDDRGRNLMRRAALQYCVHRKLQISTIGSICKSEMPDQSVEVREAEEERDMVSKREVVPQDESAVESCLHCEINDVVQEHVEGPEKFDLAEMTARMAESLVDLVLRAPEEQQAQLLAATIAYVGQAFLKKPGQLR